MSPIISSMEHDQTATIVEHLDVSYGPDEAHRIDFYQSSTLITSEPAPPLLLFVHGGEWHSGSRKDHSKMARELINKSDGDLTVGVLGYRLAEPTGNNQHPTALSDLFLALRFLLLHSSVETIPGHARDGYITWTKHVEKFAIAEKYGFDPHRVVLMGHEVGAWMAAAVLLDARVEQWGKESVVPTIGTTYKEGKKIVEKVMAWILVDGIYDLQSLLEESVVHRTYLSQAFPLSSSEHGTDFGQLKRASATSWYARSAAFYYNGEGPRVHVCHSTDNEKLSQRQSDEMVQYLDHELFHVAGENNVSDVHFSPAEVNLKTGSWGSHAAILTNEGFLSDIAGVVSDATGPKRKKDYEKKVKKRRAMRREAAYEFD